MTTTEPPATASTVELVHWVFDTLNRHDIAPLKQFWTEDTVERFPDQTCRGAEEIGAYFEDAFRAIPDFHMEVKGVAEDGENAFVRWHLTGTHLGALMGIEPTGRRLAIDGIDHFVVRDGKLVSNFVVADQMQYARQLGLMPADGTAADRAVKRAFNARTKLMAKLKR